MKNKIWLVLVLALALALSVTPAWAQGPRPSGGVIFGGNITVESGTTAEGSLIFGGNVRVRNGGMVAGDIVLFGGNMNVEQGGKIAGDIVLLGGNVDIAGEVSGDISIAGGNVNLRQTALVDGSVNIVGGNLNRTEGSVVRGSINQGNNPRFNIPFISFTRPFERGFDFFGGVIGALAMAALGALLMVFFPTPIQRVSETVQNSPLPSAGVGCLTALVLPMLALVLTITIIGIPLVVLLAIAGVAAWYFGWITIGYLAGQRILEALRVREIAPVLAVIVGVLFIALIGEVPCLGGIVSFLIGLLGLGAVILTRFGTRRYPYMPLLAAPAPASTSPSAMLPPTQPAPPPDQPSDTPPTIG